MNKEIVIGQVKDKLFNSNFDSLSAKNLEYLREPLMSLRVEAYKELCKKRNQYLHPKDKEMTDLDRKTKMEAAVADVQAEYELVRGLEELVRERVELIKILLKDK